MGSACGQDIEEDGAPASLPLTLMSVAAAALVVVGILGDLAVLVLTATD